MAGTRLLAGALIAASLSACAGGSGGPDGGERVDTWLDNGALPAGRRVALIVVGLGKPGVTEHALRSIQANVVNANGGGDRVHVFVNAEPEHGLSVSALEGLIKARLDQSSLKGFTIVPSGATRAKMRAVNAWTTPVLKRVQFDRGRDTFPLVLAQEQRNGERYAAVCRLRTDTIWLDTWDIEAMTNMQANTVAGPTWDNPGWRKDLFWIAGRDAAWRAFTLPSTFSFLDISDADMWEMLQCDRRAPEDDWFVQGDGTFSARACEDVIPQRPRSAPEVTLTYALRKMGLEMRDACLYTGPALTFGSHIPFDVTCAPHAPPRTWRKRHPETGLVASSLSPERGNECMYLLSWDGLVHGVKYAYLLVVHDAYAVGQIHWDGTRGAAVCVEVLATAEAAYMAAAGLTNDLDEVELQAWLLDMAVGGPPTSEQARRLVDDWHSGGESSEVADGMGVLAFGRWHVLYTSVTSCPGPPGTEGGGRHCAVDERLKNAHSTDSLRLVVHPHDAWDRNLQVLEREVRANGSLWHDDLLLPFLPVSQAPI
eukprot:Tamp_10422.p1 GENE.Tamp_10422~~Tamp_10422.p1  ORF type:complete len:540 (-),score=79.06 Tamp_10422:54-1673(-)